MSDLGDERATGEGGSMPPGIEAREPVETPAPARLPATHDDLVPNMASGAHRLEITRLKRVYPYHVLLENFSTGTYNCEKQYLVPVYRESAWCEWHRTRTFGFVTEDNARDFATRQDGTYLGHWDGEGYEQ